MGHFPFSEKHLMSDDLPKVCLKCESFVIYCLSDKQIGYNFSVKKYRCIDSKLCDPKNSRKNLSIT